MENPEIKEVKTVVEYSGSGQEITSNILIGNLVQLQSDALEKEEENKKLRELKKSLEEKVRWLRSQKQPRDSDLNRGLREIGPEAMKGAEGTYNYFSLARVINKLVSERLSNKKGILFYKQMRIKKDRLLISHSEYFDLNYLTAELKEFGLEVNDPIAFFLEFGSELEISPSEKFDTKSYLEMNPDVKASGTNPLLHYIKHGKAEGRVLI